MYRTEEANANEGRKEQSTGADSSSLPFSLDKNHCYKSNSVSSLYTLQEGPTSVGFQMGMTIRIELILRLSNLGKDFNSSVLQLILCSGWQKCRDWSWSNRRLSVYIRVPDHFQVGMPIKNLFAHLYLILF